MKTNENTRYGVHILFTIEFSEFGVINSQEKCNAIVMRFEQKQLENPIEDVQVRVLQALTKLGCTLEENETDFIHTPDFQKALERFVKRQ